MDEPTALECMACNGPVTISITRKGNRLPLRCQKGGKHFHGFVMDREFVQGVIRRVERLNTWNHEDARGSAELDTNGSWR